VPHLRYRPSKPSSTRAGIDDDRRVTLPTEEAMSVRPLIGAAAAFAATTVFGSVVALKEEVDGEPLGVRLPISVPMGLATGWGSGLSAPWPMPALALIAALRSDGSSGTPGRICAAIGGGVIFGTLIEPVTWHRRPRSRWASGAILLNVLAGAALATRGFRSGARP
jgi:hypothetical protein